MARGKWFVSVVFVVVLSFQGCASIVSDSNYPVALNSSPDGANVTISSQHSDVIETGVTPMRVFLPTKCSKCRFFGGEDYVVTFTKEGYSTRKVQIKRNADGWYVWGNILFGGLIGWLIVDPATGSMWKLEDSVHESLQQISSAEEEGSMLNIVMLSDLPKEYRSKLVPIPYEVSK